MSKALYLSVISGRFIRYKDIPATSHTPQLLASNCFSFWKKRSKGWLWMFKSEISSIDKHDTIYTEYEFSLDGKWPTLNLSTSSSLKLQLSRLLVTRCLVFLHFDTASESTETAISFWKKVEKSLNLKTKFSYRFTLFLIWGIFIGDEGGIKSWPVFGLASRFFISLKRSWDVAWFDWYRTS